MSHPFGPKCKLVEYLDWAVGQGCAVNDGLLDVKSWIRIVSPAGRYALVFDMQRGEWLPDRHVRNLDRLLGMISPFLNSPE